MSHAAEPTYIPVNNPIAFLRYLHGQRFSDREIAEYLNDPPLYLLHQHPDAEVPPKEAPRRVWTRRMVRRWRKKLRLPGKQKLRRDFKRPADAHRFNRQKYGRHWIASTGLQLARSQTDILDALLEHGDQTMRQLMERHGWTRPPTVHKKYTAIGPLVSAGVVDVTSTVEGGKVVRLYRLADAARPVCNPRRRPTGVEQVLATMGCN